MTREELEVKLEGIQDTAATIAKNEQQIVLLENEIKGLRRMIEVDTRFLQEYRESIMEAMFGEEKKEEPDPNSDPEDVPPVTDMEEVKMLVPVLKSAIGVAMRNRITGEEREFKSKNQAAKFLNVSYPKMNDIIAKGGMYGDWNVTLNVHDADTPTA